MCMSNAYMTCGISAKMIFIRTHERPVIRVVGTAGAGVGAGWGGGGGAPKKSKVLFGAGVEKRPVLPPVCPSPKTLIRPPMSSSEWTLCLAVRVQVNPCCLFSALL